MFPLSRTKSFKLESFVNDLNLSPALLSPEIDLPHDIANFIDNIPVATDNTKLNYTRFLDLRLRWRSKPRKYDGSYSSPFFWRTPTNNLHSKLLSSIADIVFISQV
jgi:hypothetical protein